MLPCSFTLQHSRYIKQSCVTPPKFRFFLNQLLKFLYAVFSTDKKFYWLEYIMIKKQKRLSRETFSSLHTSNNIQPIVLFMFGCCSYMFSITKICRNSHGRYSLTTGVLKNVVNLLKDTPTQVFFWEVCEIFKNNYFEEHLRKAASDFAKKIHYLTHEIVLNFVQTKCSSKTNFVLQYRFEANFLH